MSEITETMLAEWERLANEATPGPWRADSASFRCVKEHQHGAGKCRYTFNGWQRQSESWANSCGIDIHHDPGNLTDESTDEETPLVAGTVSYDGGGIVHRRDADFITAARTALPALIAEVRRLRSSVPGTTRPEEKLIDLVRRFVREDKEAPGELRWGLHVAEDGTDLGMPPDDFASSADALLREIGPKPAPAPSPGTTETGTRDGDDLTGDLCSALRLLALVKEWRDSDGNEPFPHKLRERIDAALLKHNFSWHRAALPVSRGEATRVKPCGCVLCVCEDEVQCHGCGAKKCATHAPSPGSETPRGAGPTKVCQCADRVVTRRDATKCGRCGGRWPAPAAPPSPGGAPATRGVAWLKRADGRGRVRHRTAALPTSEPWASRAATTLCGEGGFWVETDPVDLRPCPKCEALAEPAPSPSMPGDNHAEKEE